MLWACATLSYLKPTETAANAAKAFRVATSFFLRRKEEADITSLD
jgi:hypothetical protein